MISTPETTADLMGGFLARLGGQGRALEYRVFDAYARAAGEMLGTRSRPEALRGGTLLVRVASSALAHELTMLRPAILGRMAGELGPGVVTDLRTRVGVLEVAASPPRA